VPVSVNIEFDDKVFAALRKKITEASKKHVHVGVLASKGGNAMSTDGETTLAELAAIHEYGAPKAGIPARSFIRATFQDGGGREGLGTMLAKLAKAVLSEKFEVDHALDVLGAWAQAAIKKRIVDRIAPALRPATIKRKTLHGKTADVPLVETGQLINAITWEVEK
jgi:hypothetical protein